MQQQLTLNLSVFQTINVQQRHPVDTFLFDKRNANKEKQTKMDFQSITVVWQQVKHAVTMPVKGLI